MSQCISIFSRYWCWCLNWGYKAAQASERPEWSLQQACNPNQQFSRLILQRSLMLGMDIFTTQYHQSAGTSIIKLFWRLHLEKRSPFTKRLIKSHPLEWRADVNFWCKKESLLCPRLLNDNLRIVLVKIFGLEPPISLNVQSTFIAIFSFCKASWIFSQQL